MSESIKLSICIATLNRAAFIGETLDSIVSQLTDVVEVVIVDGASTDNTQAIVLGYQKIYPCIRYFRLEEKGGVDQDYSRAVDWARGQYCWLFSDDDILLPGAVASVLDAIDRNYSLVIVNSEVRTLDLGEVLKSRALNHKSNIVYGPMDFEAFFADVASYLSFIGCVVVQKKLWDARDKKTYFGSLFIHMGVIFQQPMASEVLVLAHPLIAIRYGNALWSSSSFSISLFKWPDLIWSFAAISERVRQQVSVRDPWRSAPRLLVFRARGAYGREQYLHFLQKRMNGFTQRMVAQLIATLPGGVTNLLLWVFFFLLQPFHKNARLHMIDLESSRFFYGKILRKFFRQKK